MKTLSLKTCKLLNELLGEEYETDIWWCKSKHQIDWTVWNDFELSDMSDSAFVEKHKAYSFEDLLSRNLLEALGRKLGWKEFNLIHTLHEKDGVLCPLTACDVVEVKNNSWQYHAHKLLDLSWEEDGISKVESYLLQLIQKKDD